MTEQNDAPDEGPEEITFDNGRPILSAQGHHVAHPDYVNSLPWIERRRLTWDEFCARAAERGLPAPSPRDWADTFVLTDGELGSLNALIESQERGDLSDLDKYFFVQHFGNKPRVCWRQSDGLLGHMSVGEFKTAHLEKHVQVEGRDGKPRRAPLTELWLHNPRTPRYEGVEFRPGVVQALMPANVYNLWQGWPEGLPRETDLRPPILGEVIPGDDAWDGPREPVECSLFLHHVREHVCGGDEDVYEYVLGWIADALLRPGLCETAIAMTGPSGSGKGTFAHLLGSFFGPHFQPVNDRDKLTGKFNRHLMEAQLVFADEVEFSGADQASKTLRNLVTEPTLQIEPKGVDSFFAPKWFRIILASNDRHIISALHDDRRYLVLHVDAGEHNQDRDYFRDVRRQWSGGGQVALFRWLTGRYWTEQIKSGAWDVGQRPVTAALQEQKEMSLSPADQFLLGILEDGVLPGVRPRNRSAPRCTILSNSDAEEGGIYQCMRASSPGLKNVSNVQLAKILKQGGCTAWVSHGERGWTFPELGEMRAAWCERFGDRAWPDGVVEWFEEPVQQEVPF